jgi:UDP-N-acetylglucosamine 2-epimerase (non-hydrolysing)
MKPHLAIVLGTRPEIIKMSPVIRRAKELRVPFTLIHTGQHYSASMDSIFFTKLKLPKPNIRLNIGRAAKPGHGAQTALMLESLETVFKRLRPDVLLVQGDTNTVLAGAIAASKIPGIRIGHVEAGLRSYDRTMPEESNRIITDHLSDYLFAPTTQAAAILRSEGIEHAKIHVTGNTIVDAVRQNLKLVRSGTSSLMRRSLKAYALMTLHRQENVDDPRRLKNALDGIGRVSKELSLPVLFPMHPRTVKQIRKFGIHLPNGIQMIEPTDFLQFLDLESDAHLILTDSGGVQEEACILRVPCVTLRDTTERPETVRAGGNVLAGTDPRRILSAAKRIVRIKRNWKNPFGDGRAAERIINLSLRGN